jgi:hypothetical protein
VKKGPWMVAVVTAMLAASPRLARADLPTAAPTPPPDQPPATPAAEEPPSEKRPLPDYDGRGPRGTTAGEAALWVPRAVLSPVYFTTEWLIRRPLGATISAAERANLPNTLYNFFTF